MQTVIFEERQKQILTFGDAPCEFVRDKESVARRGQPASRASPTPC